MYTTYTMELHLGPLAQACQGRITLQLCPAFCDILRHILTQDLTLHNLPEPYIHAQTATALEQWDNGMGQWDGQSRA